MKKIILRLLPWLVTLVLIALLVVFVGIPLYASPEESHDLNPTVVYYEGNNKKLTMESDKLLFEMDPQTTQFKVVEKTTGQEWLSNPKDASKDKLALAANKEMLSATLVATYATTSGTIDLNNYKYSIENGNYTIEQMDEHAIKVSYAVGKIEKKYLIPTAMTKDRFTEFTGALKKSTANKIKNSYTLYDQAKLDKLEDAKKAEIVEMYPEVVNQPLYILKSDTKATQKAKLEGYFEEGNYTQEDYEIDQQLVAKKAETKAAVFNVNVIYRLDGDDLVVEVPYGDIRYYEEYPLTSLTILPMFGAAGLNDEGFMLVPEGGGALINFNNGRNTSSSYYANLYGWDYASVRKEMVSETKSNFPVFGMARNGNSFICIIEGASAYAGVQADVSQRFNSYNWLCAKYKVLHYDTYNMTAKGAQLVYMFEKEMPQDSIIQRYRFVEGDSYVDMANAYGDYLRATYPEFANAKASEEMPVSVELIGAIDKTVEKFGLPIDSVVATTTFEQAENIMTEMKDKGVKNLNVRFSGWANGGINQKVLTNVKVVKELGGEKGMASLIAKAKALDVPLYFDGINCFAYDSDVFDGFLNFSDAARYTTREQICINPYDIVTYQMMDWVDPYYLVRPEYAKNNASNLIEKLGKLNAYGVAFRDIGNLLSGDYNVKNRVTREQVKEMNIQTMQEAHAAGQRVMVKQGNDYAVPYADMITDMSLAGSKYAILNEAVPFYQIALHGVKDYTGQPINLASDYYQEFLKCVEYGSGLNFTFMAENTRILQDTLHSGFYAAYYKDWAEDACEMIAKYQTEMAGLNTMKIVDHDLLTEDVSVTGYENGAKVYVNYGETDYTVDGLIIPARGYFVERGDNQ